MHVFGEQGTIVVTINGETYPVYAGVDDTPTATGLPPSLTPTVTKTCPPPVEGVIISYIFYDGAVPYVESDEYAQITNNGTTVVDLAGWRLNAGDPGQDFIFPSYDFQPGQLCRMYTNITPSTVDSAVGVARLYGIIMGIAGIYILVMGYWWMIIVIDFV